MSGEKPTDTAAGARQAQLDEADRLEWVAKNTRDPDIKAHFLRAAGEIRNKLLSG